jgi:hypothetical protein
MYKNYLFFLIGIMYCFILNAQPKLITGSISKEELGSMWGEPNKLFQIPLVYVTRIGLDENCVNITTNFKELTYRQLNGDEDSLIQFWAPSSEIKIDYELVTEKKRQKALLKFSPFRLNPITSKIEVVETFSIEVSENTQKLKSAQDQTYATESLLKSGNWFKIKIDTTGVFRLTYDDLKKIGLSNPENTRVFSYGGRQLSFWNNKPSFDDLNEIPTEIFMGNDNSFNAGDYIIFYAEGAVTLNYDTKNKFFIHKQHDYSKFIYLFLTCDLGKGLQINTIENNQSPDYTSTSFDAIKYYELDKVNLVRSGRRWYDEKRADGFRDSVLFYFPNIVQGEKITGSIAIAGRKAPGVQSTYFNFKYHNNNVSNIAITNSYAEYIYATYYNQVISFTPTDQNNIYISYIFNSASSLSEGYLDYICLNARQNLVYNTSHQLLFRDSRIPVSSNARYIISNNGHSIQVWDISTPTKPSKVITNAEGNTTSFNFWNDQEIKEFVAFDESVLLKPIIEGDDLGLVTNQNIHAQPTADLVIVSNVKFLKEAEELAELHRQKDNLTVSVFTPQQLYNEFSGGTPDVSAIRNYMRMLYKRSDVELPRYLLLFGDGSYDNKDILGFGSNLILTYQSESAEAEATSFVSDDFFGMLDDNEGETTGALDIGIGRFPVQTEEEAKVMVEKVKTYMSAKSMGDWRNTVTLIADDETSFVNNSEKLIKQISGLNDNFNFDKIYLDAYKQVSISSGERFPDVTEAINEQIDRGTLLIEYIGHGNPRLLAHEEILTVQDVKTWTNYNKLTFFITASCEVGRFDDHDRISLGEWILLNPTGGGIAAFTTTRVTYDDSNYGLCKNLYDEAFNKNNRIGDFILYAKNNAYHITPDDNFLLLGDPALKLAVPQNNIVVSEINDSPLAGETNEYLSNTETNGLKASSNDAINALDTVTVKGYIVDETGNMIEKNGILQISVYDKPVTITSNGYDMTPKQFEVQNSILYKGKDSIENGYFDFSFIVPKDINYSFGNGKISLYASIDSADGAGFTRQFMIGGTSNTSIADWDGPEINLFMNDENFINGGVTDENPVLLAQLIDESGINTTGNGIGHNITAILDNNQDNVLILNNYYEGYINTYKSGEVRFPLSGLKAGEHSLIFKAWDIYNNSSEAKINFTVYGENTVAIENLHNYPNPFYDETFFAFEHNQSDIELEIEIDIYDLMGKCVARLVSSQSSNSFAIEPIRWTGITEGGDKLAKGLYIYRARLTTSNGLENIKSSKLMILK